jgi:hypothetical protein
VREIIKEHRFELELRELRGSAEAADGFIEALEWALSRRCPLGSQVSTDPPVWFVPMVDEPRLTPLCLYYTFDSKTIHFLSIRVAQLGNN